MVDLEILKKWKPSYRSSFVVTTSSTLRSKEASEYQPVYNNPLKQKLVRYWSDMLTPETKDAYVALVSKRS